MTCTRRALLGAAGAAVGVPGAGARSQAGPHPNPLPQAGEGAGSAGSEEGEWALALAELGRAEAELGVVERGTRGLPYLAAEAVQGAYDARSDAWEAALGRAFLVPAPDVVAFAAKVVWAVDLQVAEFGDGEAWLQALRADAVRLGG